MTNELAGERRRIGWGMFAFSIVVVGLLAYALVVSLDPSKPTWARTVTTLVAFCLAAGPLGVVARFIDERKS